MALLYENGTRRRGTAHVAFSAPGKRAATSELGAATDQFFVQAKREGNPEVVAKLETVLKAAMSAKQATLRPEIQLLNSLLACKTADERKKAGAALPVAFDAFRYRPVHHCTLPARRCTSCFINCDSKACAAGLCAARDARAAQNEQQILCNQSARPHDQRWGACRGAHELWHDAGRLRMSLQLIDSKIDSR